MILSETGDMLVVAAHPDDEVLGCGGTIARLRERGRSPHLLIMGEGITSRYASPDQADPAEMERLKEQCRRSARILGAREPIFLGFPDNRMDSVPFLDIVKAFEAILHRIGPATILTHHGGDLNVDHQLTVRAVLTACRPTSDIPVNAIYSFFTCSSTEWTFGALPPTFDPNCFVDITETLDIKCRAMAAYETEARSAPHPRSIEGIRSAACHFGSMVGFSASEPFMLLWSRES